MGKLAQYMAMRKEMTFEIEQELRTIRDLILGLERLSGSYYVMELGASRGFAAATLARAEFVRNLRAPLNEILVQYAHDLVTEALALGVPEERIESALGGAAVPLRSGEEHRHPFTRQGSPDDPCAWPSEAGSVRFAASA